MAIDVISAIDILIDSERAMAPYKTGNLRDNGIGNVECLTPVEAHYRINEGGKSGDAPYGPILNEAIMIWHGGKVRVNIHYGWHKRAFELGVRTMAEKIGGEIL